MATPRKLTVTDDRLAEALAGRAYLLFDGGMGTLVQAAGLHTIHEVPDLLNLTHPEAIVAIQRQYVEAGADCITTNTFSANRLKLASTDATVAEVYAAAAANARAAGAPLVAGDIGPTGALLEPLGTLTFDEAFDIFSEQACAAEAAGCDLIVVETMADLLEAKAAVLAAVESTTLPVFATMTFGEDGRTFLGTTPAIAATTLSALGASAVGLNCSLGPVELAPLVEELAPHDRALVMAQPNAGLPRIQDGETVFDVGPDEFARAMEAILDAGATVVGGCCGTTPAHIAALSALLDARPLPAVEPSAPRVILSERSEPKDLPAPSIPNPLYRPAFAVTSAQQMVSLPEGEARIAVIGERINPTGKKKLKAALQAGDVDYLVAEAAAQQRAGADILDVNVGVPGLDEPALLSQVTRALQATVPLPLQLDSSDPAAIEAAARAYAGRPMVNSVNGKADNLATVLPVVARYGCTVVGLTLDENGIPPTAEERLAIAERIVATAESYGIPREDVAIDCLVMARGHQPRRSARNSARRGPGEGAPRRAHGARCVEREFRPAGAPPREQHLPRRCLRCRSRYAHPEPPERPLPRHRGHLPHLKRAKTPAAERSWKPTRIRPIPTRPPPAFRLRAWSAAPSPLGATLVAPPQARRPHLRRAAQAPPLRMGRATTTLLPESFP